MYLYLVLNACDRILWSPVNRVRRWVAIPTWRRFKLIQHIWLKVFIEGIYLVTGVILCPFFQWLLIKYTLNVKHVTNLIYALDLQRNLVWVWSQEGEPACYDSPHTACLTAISRDDESHWCASCILEHEQLSTASISRTLPRWEQDWRFRNPSGEELLFCTSGSFWMKWMPPTHWDILIAGAAAAAAELSSLIMAPTNLSSGQLFLPLFSWFWITS